MEVAEEPHPNTPSWPMTSGTNLTIGWLPLWTVFSASTADQLPSGDCFPKPESSGLTDCWTERDLHCVMGGTLFLSRILGQWNKTYKCLEIPCNTSGTLCSQHSYPMAPFGSLSSDPHWPHISHWSPTPPDTLPHPMQRNSIAETAASWVLLHYQTASNIEADDSDDISPL